MDMREWQGILVSGAKGAPSIFNQGLAGLHIAPPLTSSLIMRKGWLGILLLLCARHECRTNSSESLGVSELYIYRENFYRL